MLLPLRTGFSAAHARSIRRTAMDVGGPEAFVTFNPIGVVLAVMPWNFPFWQVFRFAAPALMAGNGALLKHASNVPGCALAIEQVLHEAGVPRDLFRTLLLPSSEVEALIKDENVAAVRSTGASRPAAAWRPPRARSARSACSSSAAPTLMWCWKTPTSARRRGRGKARMVNAARAASPQEVHRRAAVLEPVRVGAGQRCAASRWAPDQRWHEARADAERQSA